MARRKTGNNIFGIIVVEIFKIIWFIISLPFRGLRRRKNLSVQDRQYILGKRDEIERSLQSNNIFELKNALIEADKLVDFQLEKKGFGGQTLAERLRQAQQFISQEIYNQLWQGHKLRNRVVHEHDMNFPANQLREAARKLLKLNF